MPLDPLQTSPTGDWPTIGDEDESPGWAPAQATGLQPPPVVVQGGEPGISWPAQPQRFAGLPPDFPQQMLGGGDLPIQWPASIGRAPIDPFMPSPPGWAGSPLGQLSAMIEQMMQSDGYGRGPYQPDGREWMPKMDEGTEVFNPFTGMKRG